MSVFHGRRVKWGESGVVTRKKKVERFRILWKKKAAERRGSCAKKIVQKIEETSVSAITKSRKILLRTNEGVSKNGKWKRKTTFQNDFNFFFYIFSFGFIWIKRKKWSNFLYLHFLSLSLSLTPTYKLFLSLFNTHTKCLFLFKCQKMHQAI